MASAAVTRASLGSGVPSARHGDVGGGEVFHDVPGVLLQLVAVFLKIVRDAHDELRPGDDALPAVLGREVRAAEKGPPVGQAKGVQRPAAVLVDHLDGLHVNVVHVRALLAVHLDADKVLVHEPGDVRVLEALALHHVAPVAGAVANRHDDGHVPPLRLGKGFRAPGLPVDGVFGVLAQVEAVLVGEAVAGKVVLGHQVGFYFG